VTNVARQTPCDVAASAKHVVIAKLLESKMVFAVSDLCLHGVFVCKMENDGLVISHCLLTFDFIFNFIFT